jgi:hypothetical protein
MGALKKLFKPKGPTIVMPSVEMPAVAEPPPTPQAAAEMPIPMSDSVEIKRAQKLQTTRRMQRAGRASTILSSGSSGGDDYGSPRLG